MKVYFTAAISQKPEFENIYQRIINFFRQRGDTVLAENILKLDIKKIEEVKDYERLKWYYQSLKNITLCDLMVVEISFPSTVNVGHELSVALNKGKPVIALYQENRDPIFLRGLKDEKLMIYSYEQDNLESILAEAIKEAAEQMDVRFNFFISPKIGAYLDWIARTKKIPRAVYLRRLIEEDMLKKGYIEEKNQKNNKNKK